MKTSSEHIIYTIGHSTHELADFVKMLQSFDIRIVADIRSFPGSRRFPQFNRENLEASLKKTGVHYIHLKDLGGRRKVRKDSRNNRWRNDSFRGYADYMETEDFEKGIADLTTLALKELTAFMCSEAVWWRCHRSMVSDYLKAKGWTVLHIVAAGKTEEHPYTQPAKVEGDRIFYYDKELFDN